MSQLKSLKHSFIQGHDMVQRIKITCYTRDRIYWNWMLSYQLRLMHFLVGRSCNQFLQLFDTCLLQNVFLKRETWHLIFSSNILCTVASSAPCKVIAKSTNCKDQGRMQILSCGDILPDWQLVAQSPSPQIHAILTLPAPSFLMKLNPVIWVELSTNPHSRCFFKPPASAKEPPLMLPLQA